MVAVSISKTWKVLAAVIACVSSRWLLSCASCMDAFDETYTPFRGHHPFPFVFFCAPYPRSAWFCGCPPSGDCAACSLSSCPVSPCPVVSASRPVLSSVHSSSAARGAGPACATAWRSKDSTSGFSTWHPYSVGRRGIRVSRVHDVRCLTTPHLTPLDLSAPTR